MRFTGFFNITGICLYSQPFAQALLLTSAQRWRPTEQAPVESEHQEVQRTLGMLIHEVVRCAPGEWAELLPVVEFIRFNTPSRSGLTPRDLDRSGSLASKA